MAQAIQTYFPGYAPPPSSTKKPKPLPSWMISGQIAQNKNQSESLTPTRKNHFWRIPFGNPETIPARFPLVDVQPLLFLPEAPEIALYVDDLKKEIEAVNGLRRAVHSPKRAQAAFSNLQRLIDYNLAETALKTQISDKKTQLEAARFRLLAGLMPPMMEMTAFPGWTARRADKVQSADFERRQIVADFRPALSFLTERDILDVWITRQEIAAYLAESHRGEMHHVKTNMYAARKARILYTVAALPEEVDADNPALDGLIFRLADAKNSTDSTNRTLYTVEVFHSGSLYMDFRFVDDTDAVYDAETADGVIKLRSLVGKSFALAKIDADAALIRQEVFLFLAEKLRAHAIKNKPDVPPPPESVCSENSIIESFGFIFSENGYLQGFSGENSRLQWTTADEIFNGYFECFLEKCGEYNPAYEKNFHAYARIRQEIQHFESQLRVAASSSRACSTAPIPAYAKTGPKTSRDEHGRARYARGEGHPVATGLSGTATANITVDEKNGRSAHPSSVIRCDNKWLCYGCSERDRVDFQDTLSQLQEQLAAQGYQGRMITLTIPHHFSDLLTDTAPRFHKALKSFLSRMRRAFPEIIGFAWSKELPFSASGWHLHSHLYFFVGGEIDMSAVDIQGARIWADACRKNRLRVGERGFCLSGPDTPATYLAGEKPSRLPMGKKEAQLLGYEDSGPDEWSVSAFVLGHLVLSHIHNGLEIGAAVDTLFCDSLAVHYFDYANAMRGAKKHHIDKSLLSLVELVKMKPDDGTAAIFFDNAEQYYEYVPNGEEILVTKGKKETQYGKIVYGGMMEYLIDDLNFGLRKPERLQGILLDLQKEFGTLFLLPPPAEVPDEDGKTPPERADSRRQRSLDYWLARMDRGDFSGDEPYLIRLLLGLEMEAAFSGE